jgi:gamma-glutamyl-gamma-aminobutyrate hydrolase PuuD
MTDRPARPLIGISIGRHVGRHGRAYMQLPESYAHAVASAGGAPVLVPPLDPDTEGAALERIFSALDGMLFPGGLDVHPSRYGQEVHPTVEADEALDALELKLAAWSVEREVPTLGICRGQQLLNVALGGTLIQDLPSIGIVGHRQPPENRMAFGHGIGVAEGSQLARIFGTTAVAVNSYHHQAVDALGRGLKAVAWSADGIVEGLEAPGHRWLVTVQYHPEDLVPEHIPSTRLFEAFVAACAGQEAVAVGAVARG